MLQLPVLIKAIFLILSVTAIPIQQAALVHVLHRTTQWDPGKAEHLIDQIYSKGTHMKAMIQQDMLQEQTALVDGCGHQDSQKTHHRASQKPSLCNPKLPGTPVTDQGPINSKDSQLYQVDLQPPPFSPLAKSLFSVCLPAHMGQSLLD